ncbi:N-acetylmuramoyl-L-alanine amidase family protein [Bacillus sp. JJ1562]|uniref:N-acetylmuramoyl-L-alanine amidase family protein n=1 Tax=Bacillus sp. JJ1562 TaxID=3122960 RepID=UPI003001E067
MKRKLLIYFSILSLAFVATKVFKYEDVNKNIEKREIIETAKTEKLVLEGKRIVLDPGHGGNDIGASGQHGTLEKQVTLETTKKIMVALEEAGAEVILTRDDDEYVELEDRVLLATENKANIFISIHYDAFETNDVYGMTTYYYNKRDKRMAECFHEHILMQNLSTRDRGVSYGDYYVLSENKVPAVLLELGYISNAEDEANIITPAFQTKVATGIVEGIIDYFRA